VRSYDPVTGFFEEMDSSSAPFDDDAYFRDSSLFGEQHHNANNEDDSLAYSDDSSVSSLDLDDDPSLSGEDDKAPSPTIVFENDTGFISFEDDTNVKVTTKTWQAYRGVLRLAACLVLACTPFAGLKSGFGNAPVASVQELTFQQANETPFNDYQLAPSRNNCNSTMFVLNDTTTTIEFEPGFEESVFAPADCNTTTTVPSYYNSAPPTGNLTGNLPSSFERISTSVIPLVKIIRLTFSRYLYFWLWMAAGWLRWDKGDATGDKDVDGSDEDDGIPPLESEPDPDPLEDRHPIRDPDPDPAPVEDLHPIPDPVPDPDPVEDICPLPDPDPHPHPNSAEDRHLRPDLDPDLRPDLVEDRHLLLIPVSSRRVTRSMTRLRRSCRIASNPRVSYVGMC